MDSTQIVRACEIYSYVSLKAYNNKKTQQQTCSTVASEAHFSALGVFVGQRQESDEAVAPVVLGVKEFQVAKVLLEHGKERFAAGSWEEVTTIKLVKMCYCSW